MSDYSEEAEIDAEDVYSDLPNFDFGRDIEKVQAKNQELQAYICKLEKDCEKLSAEIAELKKTQENLTKNISELFKTAKAEIDRKNKQIAELRRQLNDVHFKRNPSGTVKRVQDEAAPGFVAKRPRHDSPKRELERPCERKDSRDRPHSDHHRKKTRSRSWDRDRSKRNGEKSGSSSSSRHKSKKSFGGSGRNRDSKNRHGDHPIPREKEKTEVLNLSVQKGPIDNRGTKIENSTNRTCNIHSRPEADKINNVQKLTSPSKRKSIDAVTQHLHDRAGKMRQQEIDRKCLNSNYDRDRYSWNAEQPKKVDCNDVETKRHNEPFKKIERSKPPMFPYSSETRREYEGDVNKKCYNKGNIKTHKETKRRDNFRYFNNVNREEVNREERRFTNKTDYGTRNDVMAMTEPEYFPLSKDEDTFMPAQAVRETVQNEHNAEIEEGEIVSEETHHPFVNFDRASDTSRSHDEVPFPPENDIDKISTYPELIEIDLPKVPKVVGKSKSIERRTEIAAEAMKAFEEDGSKKIATAEKDKDCVTRHLDKIRKMVRSERKKICSEPDLQQQITQTHRPVATETNCLNNDVNQPKQSMAQESGTAAVTNNDTNSLSTKKSEPVIYPQISKEFRIPKLSNKKKMKEAESKPKTQDTVDSIMTQQKLIELFEDPSPRIATDDKTAPASAPAAIDDEKIATSKPAANKKCEKPIRARKRSIEDQQEPEPPCSRVLRSSTRKSREGSCDTSSKGSPVELLKPPQNPNGSGETISPSNFDLNFSKFPETVTVDISHDGAIPVLHIVEEANRTFDDRLRMDSAAASTPIRRGAMELLKDDLQTSSSFEKSPLDSSKSVRSTPLDSSSDSSAVRKRRRCILRIVD